MQYLCRTFFTLLLILLVSALALLMLLLPWILAAGLQQTLTNIPGGMTV